jgi:hypothetical protein
VPFELSLIQGPEPTRYDLNRVLARVLGNLTRKPAGWKDPLKLSESQAHPPTSQHRGATLLDVVAILNLEGVQLSDLPSVALRIQVEKP